MSGYASMFRMSDDDARTFARENPFAVLFSTGGGGPMVSHVPLVLTGPDRLVGHMARVNPQVDALDGPGVAVFSGPHAAVSSRWYATPEVHVPTWNYVAVHATGLLRRLDDPHPALAVLMAQLQPEDPVPSGRADRDELIGRMARGIVAFELIVERWDGRAKLSQNRSPDDAARVVAALRARGGPGDEAVAAAMQAAGVGHPRP